MANPTVYLAGPEVFLPEVEEVVRAKKELCQRYGFTGLFPFDAEIENFADLSPEQQACMISRENEKMMHRADCAIFNCTPFRSVSMDVGTAYEVGFMRALGKPIFGYTNITTPFADRSRSYNASLNMQSIDPYTEGTEIEDFGLSENLMIAVALKKHGCDVVQRQVPQGRELLDLTAFEDCLEMAQGVFSNSQYQSFKTISS